MNRGFDFDELVDQREVAALKYNAASINRIFGEDDLFPSWVADMDFKAAPSVIAGLEVRAARLGLNMGHWFGREGAGFARLNIACPRASLEKALGQLATAIAALPGDAGR